MSKRENFCDICDLEFETKKELYKHQSYDPKHKEILEKTFDSDSDDGLIYVRAEAKTKTETEPEAKTETDTKTETEPKAEIPCWVCLNELKNRLVCKFT